MDDKSNQIFPKIQLLIKEKQFEHALQLMQVYDENLKKNYLYFFYHGLINQSTGLIKEAINCYKKTLALNPKHIISYINLAKIYDENKEFTESLENLKLANELDSTNEQIIYLLARSYQKNNVDERAIFYFNQIKSNLKKNTVVLSLAKCHSKLKNYDEAIYHYEKYLRLEKKNISAYLSLGDLYKETNNNVKALEIYQLAHKVSPRDSRIYLAVARIVKDEKKAIGFLQKAIKYARKNKGSIYAELINSQLKICDWSLMSSPYSRLEYLYDESENLRPFSCFYLNDDPKLIQKVATRCWDNFEKKNTSIPKKFTHKNKKIRVGYVSPDFHEHPVMLILAPLLRNFDREKFEIYSYSIFNNKNSSKQRNLVKKYSSHFFDLDEMSTTECVKLIESHNIDILVDLAGYTKNARTEIFLHKPAPILINYLGFPETMGSKHYDYIISDNTSISDVNKEFISEKIIYLPKTYFTYDNELTAEKNLKKSDFGLPENKITLCCLNNINKISPIEFDIWMRVLQRHKNSIFVFKTESQHVIENLINEAKLRGVEKNRLFFLKKLSHEKYLAAYNCMDLFLDTFNFNAHSTALEAIHMGVPIITKLGNKIASRAASGILKAAGMEKLVCKSEENYEALINFYIDNADKLINLKKEILRNKKTSLLFDNKNFVKNIEKAYKKIYTNFHKNLFNENICIE